MQSLIGIVGVILILCCCWLMSENKRQFPWRMVIIGLSLQIILGFIMIKLPIGIAFMSAFGNAISGFLGLASHGAEMLFGNLANPAYAKTFGFQFALSVLPVIIFFSSVMAVLYHLGIMQYIVRGMSWFMSRTLKTSGIESLNASANIFLGQTEAPLLIKPYLASATRSELHTIMVGGFITIAGGVMAGYIQMGVPASALITASVMSAPAGLMLSKIVIPPAHAEHAPIDAKPVLASSSTIVEAAANGAMEGLKLAAGIAAMLIAFVAIIAGINAGLSGIHSFCEGYALWFPENLKELFGLVFQPIGYLIGVPEKDTQVFGALIGTKISLNEFLAYADLSTYIQNGILMPKTITMATFALCGFANFSSIAIQIGGIGSMIPERKKDIAALGLKAMITGALGNLLTAALAGLLF
ncbi:MAG: NupC/NupG family nucleoside CNT transporter [Candidatus Kapaibacteriota bacterium]|jgi:CNT family concentrative nucleoside transporter